ncbi:MAG: response regulator transcription factor [Clostridiales bacterium]|nr:response regulator transcription factor [Clostridiales bacterium]
MKKILILEDDKSLLSGISQSFEMEGYKLYTAVNIDFARKILNQKIDMIILDLNLPDGDGLVFCSEIRKTSKIPIIMLTARDLEEDEIIGIESGADDYITKPFSIYVLIARVKALFRRSDNEILPNIIEIGNITLDIDKAKLYVKGIDVDITAIEFKLIKYLMENKGQLLLKEQILDRVWDERGVFVDDNTLSVNMRRIRQKIEKDASKPVYIKTIRGMGYIWHT